MSFLHLFKNKKFRSSLLSMALAFLAAISVLFATFQVNAWFKNFKSTSTNAILTNFETKIEYSIGNNSWATISDGKAIPVIIQNNTVKLDVTRLESVSVTPNNLQLRITYRGKSNAFVRLSAYGNFYNADTGTYLPQGDGLWTLNGTNWMKDDSYLYYNKKVGCKHNESDSIDLYSETHVLETITVTLDSSKLASVISPHQDYQGDLFIHVDTVQPDRFQEFWGIDNLPFTVSD